MEISADKAYWQLHSFEARSKLLYCAGHVHGESAGCNAVVSSVDRARHVLVIELFEEGTVRSWLRRVPLRDVSFHLWMLGEDELEGWTRSGFHLVLEIRHPDGTLLLLADRD